MKTLKQQFLTTALVISFFLISLGIFTYFSIQRIVQSHEVSTQLNQLAYLEARIGQTEKDFLLIESVNPSFFQSGRSPYILAMDSMFFQSEQLISFFLENRLIKRNQRLSDIRQLQDYFLELQVLFDKLTNSVIEYGYENYGLSGEMRRYIHQVESTLEQENHYELTAMMLMLRRHEKDFMLRKDIRYLTRFDNTVEEFVERMKVLGVNAGLVTMVRDYQDSFLKLAEKEIEIGTATQHGILYEITLVSENLRPLLVALRNDINSHAERQIRLYIFVLLFAFIFISVAIIAVYTRLSERFIRQLLGLKDYLTRLGKGELPQTLGKEKEDEIGQMIDSINTLTDNLRNTRNFALEVGKGNFHTDINVFGNQGDLGGSLIQMKTQLEEVARQKEFQKMEEQQRAWAAEGTSLFAQILRSHNDNLDVMAAAVIKNLVSYTNVCQGGLFALEQEDDNQQFRLKGCYAYDRKKFTEKKVDWGEGLIGACALEKEPIYMTDLPQDYMHITSGLGQTNPDCLLIVPMVHEDAIQGILELAGFDEIPEYKREFVIKVAESIAAQLSVLRTNLQTAELLERSHEMADSLRQQEEELRQNMEEMQAGQEEAHKTIEMLKRELDYKERRLNTFELGKFANLEELS